MQQTFITAYGKVIVENGILYIRNVKPSYAFSQFLKLALPLTFIIRFILYLFEDDSPGRNTGLVLLGFVSLFYGVELLYTVYKTIFLQSFSKRIPLTTVVACRTEEDTNGLEVHLFLKLRSGKERKLTFRLLEKQQEAFSALLSQYLASPKLA